MEFTKYGWLPPMLVLLIIYSACCCMGRARGPAERSLPCREFRCWPDRGARLGMSIPLPPTGANLAHTRQSGRGKCSGSGVARYKHCYSCLVPQSMLCRRNLPDNGKMRCCSLQPMFRCDDFQFSVIPVYLLGTTPSHRAVIKRVFTFQFHSSGKIVF